MNNRIADYNARADRARGYAERLLCKAFELRSFYNRRPEVRETASIAALREAVSQAAAQHQADLLEVHRISGQRSTPLRAARLEWRRAEVDVAQRKLDIALLRLEHAEGQLSIARAA